MLGEFALGFDELAALFFEAGELGIAPIVESAIAGRAHAAALVGARPRPAPCLLRGVPALPFRGGLVPSIGEEVAWIALLLLHDLEEEDGKTDRPEDDEADDHCRQ